MGGAPHGFHPGVLPQLAGVGLLQLLPHQENLDQLCLVFERKVVARAGLEPCIASFKLNRSQMCYAHDLLRHELAMNWLGSNS